MLALFPFLVTDWNTWALATYSLSVAADLCFFTKVCPAVFVSISSATAPRRGSPPCPCLAPSRRSQTWDPAAVLSSDLRGLLAPGAGLNKEGSAATDLRDILALPLVAN